MLETVKGFVADLARPWAIIVISTATAIAIVIAAARVENGNDAAILIGAAGAIVVGIYGAKAWETAKNNKHAAEVEIAKTTAPAQGA